jgi:hypothetical protein
LRLESYLNEVGSPARMTHLQDDVTGADRLDATKSLSTSFMNTVIVNRLAKIAPTQSIADSLFNNISIRIADAKKTGKIGEEGAMILDGLVKANNTIGSNADGYLKGIGLKTLEYTYLEPSNETQVGTIKHTIQSAFIRWDNPSATFFSFLLSIIIDLAALLYIIVFVPYNKNAKGARVGGPRVI